MLLFGLVLVACLMNSRESNEKENTKNLRELTQRTRYKISMQKISFLNKKTKNNIVRMKTSYLTSHENILQL